MQRTILQDRIFVKLLHAYRVLQACIGERGVWADPERYRDTCWTRDFSMAIQPALLSSGMQGVARRHLESLCLAQRANGQIPILFLDNEERWIAMKREEASRQGRKPFMLRRYEEEGGSLWNLTPGTRDSEIHFLIAMCEYVRETRDRSLIDQYPSVMRAALRYVENTLMRDGLICGADWRDTMHRELEQTPLLTNNCLLYRLYSLGWFTDQAQRLQQRIKQVFLRYGTYIDYPDAPRHFDPLGASFAVLYDIAPPLMYEGLKHSFRQVDTPFGVTIRCRHNPHTSEEIAVIDRTDGVVVWPFVVGFTILAAIKMGWMEFAGEQFEKFTRLDGLCEWYDPATGAGHGAKEQLWSATLYMRVYRALAPDTP